MKEVIGYIKEININKDYIDVTSFGSNPERITAGISCDLRIVIPEISSSFLNCIKTRSITFLVPDDEDVEKAFQVILDHPGQKI